jgi:hypothetical protein
LSLLLVVTSGSEVHKCPIFQWSRIQIKELADELKGDLKKNAWVASGSYKKRTTTRGRPGRRSSSSQAKGGLPRPPAPTRPPRPRGRKRRSGKTSRGLKA